MLIVAAQRPNTGIAAYDRENGNIAWKTPKLPGNAGYVSPAVIKINGEDHLVMVSASGMFNGSDKGAVAGYNPKTGELLWSYDGWQCPIPVPNITQISNNRIFITAGYRSGGTIMEINKKGDSYGVKEIMHAKDNPRTSCNSV